MRAARSPFILFVVAAVAASGLAVPQTVAAADPEPVRYAYDAAGRLTGVVDPARESATYGYDEAGNLNGISRRAATAVSVLSVDPVAGAPGSRVTITGTGFGTNASDNTVTFAGTTATVESATATQLVVTVPTGATSGAVAVRAPGGTASAPSPFTVEAAVAPKITSFAPANGAPGTEVTITGSGFDPDPVGNTVLFNNAVRGRVTAATASTLTVVVPDAGAGPISVRTKAGVATSTSVFTIPPGSFTLADIDTTTAIEVDGPSRQATVATAGKLAVLWFRAERGQRLSAGFTGKTFSGSFGIRLYSPVGVELLTNLTADSTYIYDNESRPLPALATTGVYQLVIDPNDANVGSITVTLSKDVDGGVLSEVGDGTPISITRAGQRARLRLSGTQGQYYALTISGSNAGTAANRIWIYHPNGLATLKFAHLSNGNGTVITDPLPVSGEYEVVVEVPSLVARSFVVSVAVAVDFGQLSASEAATTVTSAAPGQPVRLRFEGTQGSLMSLAFTGNTYSSAVVTVYQPDGTPLGPNVAVRLASSQADLPPLPATGTYEIVLKPVSGATGSATVTLAADVDAGVLSPTEAGTTVTTPRPGQNARLRFEGAVGQRFNIGVTGSTYGGVFRMVIYRPDGTVEGTARAFTNNDGFAMAPLTVAGSYEVVVDPNAPYTGSVTVTLATEVDGGTLAIDGATTTVTIPRAGQQARLRFAGTAGQRLSLGSTGSTFGGSYIATLLRPDGTTHVTAALSSSTDSVDFTALTLAGMYELVVNPTTGRSGAVTLTLSAEVDAGALAVMGGTSTVTIPRAGQNARVRFTGTAGQRLSLGSTGSTFGAAYTVTLLRPDGTTHLSSSSLSASTDSVDFPALTLSGTYELVLNPTSSRTGAVTLTLSTEIDGGVLSATGAASTVTISRVGQNARVRFAGTAGQRLSVGSTGSTLGGAYTATLLRPDGTTHVSNAAVASPAGSVDFATLTLTGTYEFVIDPTSGRTGAVTLNLSSEVDGGALTVGGAGKTVTMSQAGQNARLTFDGAVGQQLTLGFSGSTIGGAVTVNVYRPDGTKQVSNRVITTTAASIAIGALTVAGTHEIVIDPQVARTGAITLTLTAAAAVAPADAPKAAVGGMAGWSRLRKADDKVAVAAPRAAITVPAPAVRAKVPDGTWTPDKGNLAGRDWSTRLPAPKSQPDPLRAKGKTTALAGQVRSVDGRPLGGVSVRVGDVTGATAKDGRFLLPKLPSGQHRLVVESADYGRYEIRVTLAAGTTTVLPFTIWLTKLDRKTTVTFPSPTTKQVVLTTPKIPGLEVRLPAGSVVRDANGKVVTELGITAIPVDRPPFPLPSHIHVPVYFSVQPGGSYVFPQGAHVVYPNYHQSAPGTRVEFWNYEPEGRGWFIYGHGTVTPDGKQVMPDKDTRVYTFHGFMISSDLTGPAFGPNQDPNAPADGDPVDLGTGLLVDTHTDLMLPDVMPISVTRTYRQADDIIRPFGIGQNFEYGIFLQAADNQWLEADLVLADGGRVKYRRLSGGTNYTDAVYQNDDSLSEWGKSKLIWNGNGWNLTRRDGLTYIFGQYRPLQAIRDRHGNQITITREGYAQAGNITQVTSPSGKWIRFTTNWQARVTKAEDNIGRTVSYTYDSAGWLKTVTDPANKVTTYGYNAERRLATITDPRGVTYLTNEYDSAGRVKKQTLPEGAVYDFEYTTDSENKITETRVTDPNRHVRRVTFNADGFSTSETVAHGTDKAQTKTIERAPGTNRIVSTTDQRGRKSTFGYDGVGNVNSTTLLAGTADAVTVTTDYGGPYNQVSKTTDGLRHSTTYTFDANGNVRAATDAVGRSVTYTYQPDGQVATVTDPVDKKSTFSYELGDLVAVTDPLGRVTRHAGDAAGRRLATTDAAGATTRFSYDERNLVRSVTDPLGNTTSFGYDENGNQTSRTDARNHTTKWTFDEADRIETVTDPLGKTVTKTYDANGNLRTETDRRGKVTQQSYDELDRLTTVAYGVTGSASESTITYTYDTGNRLTTIADSAGGTINQTPDDLDRLITQKTPQGSVSYGYDDAGRRSSMQVAGQPAVAYDYNDADQLTTITKAGKSVSIGYDDAGRMRTRGAPGGTTQTYDYDDANQLTGITYASGGATLGNLTYSYDAAGRQASVGGSFARIDLPAAFSGATYNAADQLTALGATTFTYDGEGNLTGDGTTTYTWNARGELTVTARTGLAASFTYDGLGRRTARTVGATTTGYLYDGDTAVQELNGSAPTANLVTGGTDVHFARTDATGEHDVLTDALGSVIGLTGAGGTVATQYTYEPFGATETSGAASDNAAQFTGRENDGTGLYYYRARYYHPALQRFISQDPIGYAGGGNLYAYVNNNPTNFTDPSGNLPFLIALAGSFIVGAVIDGAISWASQTLAGRKVDWGWGGVLGDAVFGGYLNALTFGLGKGFRLLDEAADVAKVCRRPNSFTPDTRVQMADGSTKPIGNISVGDKVLATDPETGESGPREVTGIIVGDGSKDLVDLTIDGDVVTATSNHPFYDAATGTWVEAGALRTGDALSSPGRSVPVDKVRQYTVPEQTVYNLTVAEDHTYYVLAGNTPVLVHNDGGETISGTIARGPHGMTIQIYANDHGPPHAHLKGQGFDIQIGQNGKPLDADTQLNSRQQAFVDDNIRTIRDRIDAKMREYRRNNAGGCR